jgi:enoyl-CoA hydratase
VDGQREDAVLIAEQRGAVRYLTLDRPEVLNALNASVFTALEEQLARISSDLATRTVVITGAGDRAFSAGADLDELTGLDPVDRRALLERGQRVFRSLETLGIPVIAAVNGYALGGGFELALACTLIVAAESARFGLPEVGLGLIPGYGGTQRLPRAVGSRAALGMMLTGEQIDAARADELGILSQPPVPDDDLLQVVGSLADSISGKSPRAASLILKAVGYADGLDASLAHETTLAALAAASGDAEEGIAAFREKRTPRFGEAR